MQRQPDNQQPNGDRAFLKRVSDMIIKVVTAFLIAGGVAYVGWTFTLLQRHSEEFIRVDSVLFTGANGVPMQAQISIIDKNLTTVTANQNQVMKTLDKVVDRQTLMIESLGEIKAKLK
jgi:hypothetical protein